MDKLTQLGADMVTLWGKYHEMYLDGIANTLILAVVATAIGCIIGFVCGILQTIPYTKSDPIVKRFFLKLIRVLVRVYVEVFRGTPMILQAVFIFFGLPYFTDNAMQFTNMWTVSILVVSINTGAYMAESVRGGIISVDPGQTEGAKAIGMNHWQTMTNVILPQALRNILPQIEGAQIQSAAESAPAMLMALETGTVDFVCTDMPTAQGAVVVYPDMVILDFSASEDGFEVSDEDVTIGISVMKGTTVLKDALDAVLSTMTADDFNALMAEATKVQPIE